MSALSPGQTVSHYRILRPLGAGGMGEVYLAEDTKLGRQVALKVLAHESASDPDRRARFDREARAIAALNHPHIVTIYSVEEDQGAIFITMELVEGRTLAESIPSGGMPLADLLRIAIPLTDAVGTAHRRGITHRDLKPANVMVSQDGLVKVLDFGLAKQESSEALQTETALAPAAHVTAEGKILGTVAYMSPEQAQGKPVDQRSDIFSLGIVLFEMATGQRPFKGDSNVSVLSSVIKDTPPLVTELRPELPRDLARIIKHCLVKDPEERYQNAKDLRNDLKSLKEESESGERAGGPASSTTPAIGASAPARRRWAWAGVGAVLVVTAASLGAWWTSAPRLPRVISMRQITTDGAQKGPPMTDGARLYFQITHLGGGRQARPALAQVAASGGDTVELASETPSILDIDPAGTELLVSTTPGSGDGDLAVMPVLGGTQRTVGDIRINSASDNGAGAVWTPDKSHIIYAKGSELRLTLSDGTESRTLLTAPGIPFSPRVSPDGERLRYTVRDAKTGANSLWEAGANGANPHPLLPGWRGAQNPCCGTWTGDGRYYVFEADGDLWARSEAHGWLRWKIEDPVQLTFGPLRFSGVMPSRDGKRLFAIGDQRRGRLARYDPGSKQFVEYLGGLSAEGVTVSPDGGWIAYVAFPEATLWRSRLDGSDRKQLTFPPMAAYLPRWSPDGSQIAFFGGTSTKTWRAYTVPAAGGAPRRLTTGTIPEADPSWSPDGRHLVFGTLSGGQPGTTPDVTIQLLDLETGRATSLPGSQGFFSPRWSPDGRSIVALSLDSSRLAIFDVATQKWSDLTPRASSYSWPSWSADSTAVTFVRAEPPSDEVMRVVVADRRIESIASMAGVDFVIGSIGAAWYGSTPDGWPVVLLDAGTHDIYALDWEAP